MVTGFQRFPLLVDIPPLRDAHMPVDNAECARLLPALHSTDKGSISDDRNDSLVHRKELLRLGD
jgi:hypothetical protein